MKEYLDRTKYLRVGSQLMISSLKPNKAASKTIISRWVKTFLTQAGVDRQFKPHSSRSAATSAARLKGVTLQTIVRTASWSIAKTFAKFNNRPVASQKTIQSAVFESLNDHL